MPEMEERGMGKRGQPLGERSLKSKGKAIVTTRHGVGVEAEHHDTLEARSRQRQGAGPQNNPDTFIQKAPLPLLNLFLDKGR